MRLLKRLGNYVAFRKVEVLAVPLDGMLCEHRDQRADGFFPDLALLPHTSSEWMELDRPLALAEAELDAPAREQVEGGHPLGDANRTVRGQLHDAMTQANALRPLGGGAEKDLRGRAVRVLLEE